MPLTVQSIQTIFKQDFSLATKIQLLLKGVESFQTIFDAIHETRHTLCLQFYIFRNDDTGTALAQLLKEKSRDGVSVYVLYDHFGSSGTPRSFWKDMRDAGIQIRVSHPFKWTSPFNYVHRDHRKLIVIDGKRAFTGGLNVANEYSGFHLRRRSRVWRDTGILIEGPIVGELLQSFRQSWATWGGRKIRFPKDEEFPALQELAETVPALPIFAYSRKGRERMRRLLRYSADQTQESLSLTTPYFIPSRRMIKTLEKAVKRGVRVRLLVPGKSDVPAASYAGRAFFSRLLGAGVEIYAYAGEMLHAKTYLFDGCWSVIGSTNLDYQSLWYNDEGNVGIFDRSFAAKMVEVFENDLRQANRIELDRWKKRPWSEKLKEHCFALFRKRL
jgi:cardiolipin synthase A/B